MTRTALALPTRTDQPPHPAAARLGATLRIGRAAGRVAGRAVALLAVTAAGLVGAARAVTTSPVARFLGRVLDRGLVALVWCVGLPAVAFVAVGQGSRIGLTGPGGLPTHLVMGSAVAAVVVVLAGLYAMSWVQTARHRARRDGAEFVPGAQVLEQPRPGLAYVEVVSSEPVTGRVVEGAELAALTGAQPSGEWSAGRLHDRVSAR